MGAAGVCRHRAAWRPAPPPRRRRRPHAAAHDHGRRDRAHRRGPGRVHRRGDGMTWAEWVAGECDSIAAAGRWRATRDLDAAGPAGLLFDEDGRARSVVSFASNDYLGLSQHPAVVAAAHDALARWGAGSGAARLIVGSRPVHSDLEAALAGWKNTERALVFPTGFATNLGVLATFGGPGVLVCS